MPEQRRTYHRGSKNVDLPLELARVQPQAPEIEKAVLGALMIDRDAYMEVCNMLRVESFYEPRNQMIYEAIVKLSAEENPVDVLTVTDKLAKMGKLEEVGGPGYIADLSSRVATSANIVYHANIVAGNKAFDETYDIKDVVQEAESILFELSQNNMKKDYSVLSPIVDKAMEQVKIAHSNKGGITGISTGYFKLDDMTCGWQNF